MRVKAIKEGFIYGIWRKVNEEFTLVDTEKSKAKDQFSSRWMEEIKQPSKRKTQKAKT